jgi:hypothetical protein
MQRLDVLYDVTSDLFVTLVHYCCCLPYMVVHQLTDASSYRLIKIACLHISGFLNED